MSPIVSQIRRPVFASLVFAAVATNIAAEPPKTSASDWADVRTAGPLVCRADFPLDECKDLLDDLARLPDELAQSLGIPPGRATVEVYLFHDQPTYAAYMGRSFPKLPYRRAMFLQGQGPGRVFAYRGPQLGTDARHECTHALLHAALGQVPLWLDEGLAKYFELPAGQRASGSPYLDEVRTAARRGDVPSLEDLEKRTTLAEMGRAQYRDSWAWVHFLLHGAPEARAELASCLKDLAGSASPQPLSQRLRARWPDLRERCREHFRGESLAHDQ